MVALLAWGKNGEVCAVTIFERLRLAPNESNLLLPSSTPFSVVGHKSTKQTLLANSLFGGNEHCIGRTVGIGYAGQGFDSLPRSYSAC
jgi:hypothetical protein